MPIRKTEQEETNVKLTRPLAALVAVVVLVGLAPPALAAKRPATRDVLVVSNNWRVAPIW